MRRAVPRRRRYAAPHRPTRVDEHVEGPGLLHGLAGQDAAVELASPARGSGLVDRVEPPDSRKPRRHLPRHLLLALLLLGSPGGAVRPPPTVLELLPRCRLLAPRGSRRGAAGRRGREVLRRREPPGPGAQGATRTWPHAAPAWSRAATPPPPPHLLLHSREGAVRPRPPSQRRNLTCRTAEPGGGGPRCDAGGERYNRLEPRRPRVRGRQGVPL
jgi:hypothetical protein